MPSSQIVRTVLTMLISSLPVAVSAQTGFKYWNPADTAVKAPATLSLTGLYTNIATKQMVANAVRFDVNSPLWSDASAKLRWILLKPGTKAGFKEKDDYWDYPDSAVFIKQFAIDTVPGDTTSRRIWETRLLINKKERSAYDTNGTMPLVDRWYGFSYKWRKNQSDADLVAADTGNNDTIKVYPKGKTQPGVWKKWHFPTQFECTKCHVQGQRGNPLLQARSVLGFFTAQLNGKYWRGTGNQLDSLFARGILSGTKPADWTTLPRWYGITDSASPGATVDVRARSYIAANCSGCHGTRGITNDAVLWAVQNYDFHEMKPAQEFRYAAIRRADFLQDVEPLEVKPALVVPKHPEKSLLFYRQTVRDTNPGVFTTHSRQMPALATFEVYQPSLDLMRRWIMEMDSIVAGIHPDRRLQSLRSPEVRDGYLRLPADLAGGGTSAPLHLIGIDGRVWVLKAAAPGVYRLPHGLPRGVYAFRLGTHTFLKQIL